MSEPAAAHYDVVVIGAGSVGTPAAMSLAGSGLRVLTIDRRHSVGQGSNKAAIGGVRATHSDPAKIRLCLRSIEILSAWQRQYGDDIQWQPGGYVFTAYRQQDEKTLKDLLVVQKSFGLNVQWLDKQALLAIVPDVNPEGLYGGTYSPDDGHCSPLLTLHAVYERARRLGATFRFGEQVTGICTDGGRATGVKTNLGRYACDVVINAAGAWANEVGAFLGVDIPVRPDAHEAGITEPVAHFLDPLIVDIRPGPGSANCYFFQHRTGQIIFCVTPAPLLWGDDTRETSAFLPMVARRLLALMPKLSAIRVRRTWRGLYPMSPDGLPIVGWARQVQGYLVAAGMCGQGFMLGPGLGELLARMVQQALGPGDQDVLERLSPYRTFTGQEKLR